MPDHNTANPLKSICACNVVCVPHTILNNYVPLNSKPRENIKKNFFFFALGARLSGLLLIHCTFYTVCSIRKPYTIHTNNHNNKKQIRHFNPNTM